MTPDHKDLLEQHLLDWTKELLGYMSKVAQAEEFAKGVTGPSWNGVYLMGLTLAGLELIPVGSGIEKQAMWMPAPKPHPGDPNAWEESWIVPRDALSSTS